MRARGAQVTDLAVLVVAADDGVMPQTKEAIQHARAAQVPILVAINKVDKDNANIARVQQELADAGLVPEQWGGDTTCVPISAKRKQGIEELLENILLIIDVAELKANPNRLAQGVVIEGKVDKRRGIVANLLIQNGTLKQGDTLVIGTQFARVRAMFNDKGQTIKSAGLSVPVSILGLPDVPDAGSFFEVVLNEKAARAIVNQRLDDAAREPIASNRRHLSLEEFFQKRADNNTNTLNLILKADVQGSIEPIVNSLNQIEVGDMKLKILAKGTGNISESDVNLAIASEAIVLGFSVEVDSAAQRLAEQGGVDVRQYNIIYKLLEDVELAMKGLLDPIYADKVIGRALVRATFKIPRKGRIAGSVITDGKAIRSAYVRVLRQQATLYEGKITSLRRFTEDVSEVTNGYECGIGADGFEDFKEGDNLEIYIKERIN